MDKNKDYLASSNHLEQERQAECDKYEAVLIQSIQHTLSVESAKTFVEWLQLQAMAQMPAGSDYAYYAGYQNAFKLILGMFKKSTMEVEK